MPPTYFSKNVDLKLIQLVKENPVLYNPRHAKYTDSDTREVTWQKIGDSLCRPAAEFAGIQCQVHFGDFQEDKHKPGFIENMREFMPEQYASSWGIEKKIFKEYKKHAALSALDAKNLYTKTARALPTYGVTFFLVKEKQKDKKKLIPRLLGINAESILRLDEVTKEILQQWPLTHVKTYHAAKGEIFTLNFGDYSEKEYSVKTLDAYRIRDILEDYIDLIRKRMFAASHFTKPESACITQDNISSLQANIVQHVANNPMKIVEQSFVGPTKIVSHEIGKDASQGTQIVTVQQVVVSAKGNHHQQGVKGEVGMRGDMSIPFTRRLNRLNSNSVKIVTLLTTPSQAHIEDSRKIVDAMNEDLPFVRDGVQDTIGKQTSDEEKKKLQDQMNELDELMRSLTEATEPGRTDSGEVGDAAMKVADLTTQMYFALDSKLKRRSKIISRSRPSFVEDENTQRSIRKASFIAATSSAVHAVDEAKDLLEKEYSGPALDAVRAAAREAAAFDNLGKLNAAIAHYIFAHSDPNNVDYEAAVNSMNTIHELMPEFCKDAQAIADFKDPSTKKQILLDAKTLCDTVKRICSSIGMDDREKLQEASKEYAEASGRLAFTFSKGRNTGKENEMLDLADEVASKTSLLLMSAQQLTQMAPDDPAAGAVDSAGVRVAEAAKDVISQVQLCAPTITEPHCQSAVTAAAEALSSMVQQLAITWKPLVEHPDRHTHGEKMHHQVMDVAKALDMLKGAYSGLGGDEDGDVFDKPAPAHEQQRLKFISTVSANKKQWQQVEEQLNKTAPAAGVSEAEARSAQARLAQRLGQLNAAIAALLAATADRDRPDYEAAETALNTINELMPQVVQDTKMASANKDEEARKMMMEHIKALCDASKRICASSENTAPQDRGEAIANFTKASGKLVFGVSHRGNPDKENQILELADAAGQKTSQLLSGVQQLSEAVGGATGGELDAKGAACADAAKGLLTTAQLTGASIGEPSCQGALLASIARLAGGGAALGAAWRPLQAHALHRRQAQGLDCALRDLTDTLDALRGLCLAPDDPLKIEVSQEQQRLQFGRTMSAAKDRIRKAQKALEKGGSAPSGEKAEAAAARAAVRLGALGAAAARLLAARHDADAADAADTIADLMPHVIQDTQSSCANKDDASRAAMLDLLRELCEASRGLCANADGTNTRSPDDAVSKFSNASGKLVYMLSPRANANTENHIMGLTAGVCQQASQLLSGVEPLSRAAGGAVGQALDSQGAAVADAAQALLVSAQVLAPSISEPPCKKALVSCVDKVCSAGRALADAWRPLAQDPKYEKQAAALQAPAQQLETQLEALRKACQQPDRPDDDTQKTLDMPCEQKVQFGRKLSLVTEHIQKAQKSLDKPAPAPLRSDRAQALQARLGARLGELNAAIAALLAATASRDRPDYKAAEQAVRTITDLMPHVVQDTQTTSANKEESVRAAMLDLIKELCDASKALCAGIDGTNPKGLSDAVSKFSAASGKLVYVVNPQVNAEREKRIDEHSTGACAAAARLEEGVQQLVGAAGGTGGAGGAGDAARDLLEMKSAALADATQTLAATAQVTAPCISEPHCKRALLSSIERMAGAGRELAAGWAPLAQAAPRHAQAARLQAARRDMDAHLDALRNACQIPDGVPQTSELPHELQKLQFVKSMSAAKDHIQKAQNSIDKPLPPPQSADKAMAVQQRLSGRLGELNAAIAALLAAADRDRPDYKTAEEAMQTITQIMPYVVQDTQSSCANKDDASRAAMLDLLRELCEASRGLCANADGTNTRGISEAAAKFSDASAKLVYVVNPRANSDSEKQIVALSSGARQKASTLLATVQKLPTTVEGKTGQELEAKSTAVDDAAQALTVTAKMTAPSISNPHCKKAMLTSTEKLSSSAQDLVGSWKPLLQGYTWSTLKQPLQQLETQLEELRTVCLAVEEDVQTCTEIPREQQKLQFGRSMCVVNEEIQKAQKSLDAPVPAPLRSDRAQALQARLGARLGELNAAIAALLAATTDREDPDYRAAEQAAKTIAEVLPHVVEESKSSCANKDDASRAAMLDLLRELCEASRGLCANADGTNTQGLNEAVSKFSDASGKLVYVLDPTLSSKREKQIVSASASACKDASELLAALQALAPGGARQRDLDERGAALADAAHNLLLTSQLTAPSIAEPKSRAALQSSADRVCASSRELADSWRPLLQDPVHQKQAAALEAPMHRLENQLEVLRKACQIPHGDGKVKRQVSQEQHKQQFLAAMSQAEAQIRDAQKALDKAIPGPLGSGSAEAVRRRLAGRLGELNAAIASLLAASADRNKPYYETASNAIKTIADLLPHVIEESQTASANQEPASRAALLAQARALAAAGAALCTAARADSAQDLSEAVGKFSDASGKLVYVLSPQNKAEGDQIVELAASACSTSSRVLAAVQALAGAVDAPRAHTLDTQGAALADAAQALLASAQVTAPSISEPHSKAALLASAELVTSASRELAGTWKPLLQEPKHKKRAAALQQSQQQLETQVEALRKACMQLRPGPRGSPPPTPTRTVSMHGSAPPHDAQLAQDFLDRVRADEEHGSPSPDAPRGALTDDDKRLQQQFLQDVDHAEDDINAARKLAAAEQSDAAAVSVGECMSKQARLQQNIALLGVEVAALVGANYGHTIDYPSASKSMKTLPQLMSNIVEDGVVVSSTVNEKARREFLQDMLRLCDASLQVCDAAKNHRQKLNEAAVEFSDKSAKLLYVVSNDVDQALEEEIISRAKAIGDAVAQIAVGAGAVAAAPARPADRAALAPAAVQQLCAAGAACQDGAGKLLYTAKLVAPSISAAPCQAALCGAAEELARRLRAFGRAWRPIAALPQHERALADLRRDADNLDRILEGLRSDVKSGRLGHMREIQQLVVEDTPLRQLSLAIIEDAKKLSESAELSAALRRQYADYSSKSSDALRAVELADARCKRATHDTNKRRELERAIENLQMIILQSRPSRTDKEKTNIVDLRDFITEVTSEAEKLEETSKGLKVATAADKNILKEIIDSTQKLSKAAYSLTHSDEVSGFDTTFDNILDVDQFGQECDDVIRDINSQLQMMEDAKAKNALLSKILPLTESCNMLRFATKSGISTAKSVSLEATLDDLDDVESRLIRAVVCAPRAAPHAHEEGVTLRSSPQETHMMSPPTAPLCMAVCEGSSPRAPLTAYMASCAACLAPARADSKNRLLKHLYKLVHLMKMQTVTTSKRIATWQSVDDPEVTAITEQILQEIQNPESKFLPDIEKAILDEKDLTKLLVPIPAKVVGDARIQESKLTELAKKLSSMCHQLTLGSESAAALSRSAHGACAAALQLAAVARGAANRKDPVQCERVDSAAQQMARATYDALVRAQHAFRAPRPAHAAAARLRHACRHLNGTVDTLMSAASSSSALRQRCGSLARALTLQSAAPAPGALPYRQCCELLDEQHQIVYKLKNDQPMSRAEFSRSLTEVNEAVCKTAEISSNCAYLISVSEQHADVAQKGPVDVPQIQRALEALQDCCMVVIGASSMHQAKEETEDLHRRMQDFSRAIDEAQLKVSDSGARAGAKDALARTRADVGAAAAQLAQRLQQDDTMEAVSVSAVWLLEQASRAHLAVERCPLRPAAPAEPATGPAAPAALAACNQLTDNSRTLLKHTLSLVEEVTAAEEECEEMTWVTFSTSKKKLLDAYDALVKSIRANGHRVGILDGAPEEDADDPDAQNKTYLEIQVDLANKWLSRAACKADVKAAGQQAVRQLIDIATEISEELKGTDREDIRSVITEAEELLVQCTLKHDTAKYSTLMDRIKELKKTIQRGVVTRVVEDFVEVDDPAGDLELMLDLEQDPAQRQFLLERKIAELLAQLGRVTRTARVAAHVAGHGDLLLQSTDQTELLAPMLVQAAQERIASPDNQAVIDKYKALLAQYTESISKVRSLCDRAVDPMDFVQTAGDMMQRMRDESSAHNDIQEGHRTSEAIIKLANRSIEVSMSSPAVRRDPSLQASLLAAQKRVLAATPAANCRPSRLPDWKESTAEVLRTTGEVESALGGENIFKTEPAGQGTNQQIYTVARDLHECVREWSARDNDIVAAARRVAVLMARLAEYMQNDKKQSLISTSKSIVSEAHEVAALARKLAHECTDLRIKTNLLQTCERIPTISAQLKMLTTVKGSSLGHQGSKEDSEAMDMLVGNAQSLMLSIQEVVKAAAGASVKIMSQRGPRLRWVRKNYY